MRPPLPHPPTMSNDLTLDERPAGPPAASIVRVPTKDGVKEIRGRLKRALDLMVFGDQETMTPIEWNEAAQRVGFSVRRMRSALERPHVQRYIRQQKQVFRASASAGNILVAKQIRDKSANDNARMKAIGYLDGIADHEQNGAARHVTPGVVVQVNVSSRADRQIDNLDVIEVNPLGEQQPVRNDE